MRAFKTVNDGYIEPVSFTVPRRAETFQSDIFPPAVGAKPAMSSQEWLSGKEGLPPKINFEDIYEGNAPSEVPSEFKPAPAPAPAAAKPAPKKEPEQAPAPAARSPPPSMRDQGQSIAAMASKYEDDEAADDDDASSFEEIPKPAQRRTESSNKIPSPTKTTSAPLPKPAAFASAASPALRSPTVASPSTFSPTTATAPSSSSNNNSSSASSPAGVQNTLVEIKQLLEIQNKMLNSQGQQIVVLTGEVDSLKKRVGSGSQDQSERIRQLELELESLRP